MHSAWFRNTFLRVLKFLQIKEEDLISEGNQVCRKSQLFGPPILYFNFTSFEDPNSSSFIRFLCILHYSGELFSEPWNFSKLKSRDLIFLGGNQFCRKSELFGPPFCISILKVLWTQNDHLSSDFNAFCMIQKYCSQSLAISTN